jgi:hypothetical protein
MSTTPPTSGPVGKFPVIATILAALLVGAGIYELHVAHDTQVFLLAAGRDAEAAQNALKTATQREQTADQKVAELQKQAGGANGAAQAAGPTSRAAALLAREKADGQKFLAAFPQTRAMIAAIGKTQYDMIFAPFFRSAGLSAGQIEQLEDAAMETWISSIAITHQGGIHPTVTQPPDDQVRAIVGDQAFAQFQDYNRMIPAEGVALQVATAAGYASAPLSLDQANQLAQIVANNSAAYQNGQTMNVPQVDWAAALAAVQANSGFSPPQVQAAQRVLLNIQYQVSLSQARQKAAAGN